MRAMALRETISVFGVWICDSDVFASLNQLISTSLASVQDWTNSTDGVVSEGMWISATYSACSDGLFESRSIEYAGATSPDKVTNNDIMQSLKGESSTVTTLNS